MVVLWRLVLGHRRVCAMLVHDVKIWGTFFFSFSSSFFVTGNMAMELYLLVDLLPPYLTFFFSFLFLYIYLNHI